MSSRAITMWTLDYAQDGSVMTAKTCRSCGARIVWAVTTGGNRMPIDPEPADDGNMAASWDRAGQMRVRVLHVGQQLGSHERRMVSHFATCPHARQHGRKKLQS